jgi:hypothetical protein
MAILPPQIIDVSLRGKGPTSPPTILWPTVVGYGDNPKNGDSTKFPEWEQMKIRNEANSVAPLAAFVQAAAEAQDRLFVLDEFLFNPANGALNARIDEVLEWLPDSSTVNHVRLLTSSIGTKTEEKIIEDQLKERATKINGLRQSRSTTLAVEVKFTLKINFPYVHDRFAIVDNELWHFGATVGGFHNQVNAASRGWHVDDHAAVRFFEMAWAGDPGASKYHGKRSRGRGGNRA